MTVPYINIKLYFKNIKELRRQKLAIYKNTVNYST